MAEITKELGRIPVSRGDYQATIEYYKDNIVQYKRSSYQVVSESPIIGVPPTNDKNVVNPGWTLFAGTLDAQDVVNQIKEQETKSIQAVADREAEILAKSDASEISYTDNQGLGTNTVQGAFNSLLEDVDLTSKTRKDWAILTGNLNLGDTVDINGSPNPVIDSLLIPCKRGTRYKIYGKGASGPRLYCFVNQEYKLVDSNYRSTTNYDSRQGYYNIVSPINGYLIVNFHKIDSPNYEFIIRGIINDKTDILNVSVIYPIAEAYTLETALSVIEDKYKKSGRIICFKNTVGSYEYWVYVPSNVADSFWGNLQNWHLISDSYYNSKENYSRISATAKINVNSYLGTSNAMTLADAINSIPMKERKIGMTITFKTSMSPSVWETYNYLHSDVSDEYWNAINAWKLISTTDVNPIQVKELATTVQKTSGIFNVNSFLRTPNGMTFEEARAAIPLTERHAGQLIIFRSKLNDSVWDIYVYYAYDVSDANWLKDEGGYWSQVSSTNININKVVDLLKAGSIINVNNYKGTSSSYTFTDAISAISLVDRTPFMRLTYRADISVFKTYLYKYSDVSDTYWLDINSWILVESTDSTIYPKYGVVNVNYINNAPTTYYTFDMARDAVPVEYRGCGVIITWRESERVWRSSRYTAGNIGAWDDNEYWTDLNSNNPFIHEGCILKSTGEVDTTASSYYCTEYVKYIPGMTVISCSGSQSAGIACYNKSFEYIGYIDNQVGTYVKTLLNETNILDGTVYIRCSALRNPSGYVVSSDTRDLDIISTDFVSLVLKKTLRYEESLTRGKAFRTGIDNPETTPVSFTPYDNTAIECIKIRVNKGDAFIINGVGAQGPRLWAFVNDNGYIMNNGTAVANAGEKLVNGYIEAPSDGFLLINNYWESNPDVCSIRRTERNTQEKVKWCAMGDSITQGYISRVPQKEGDNPYALVFDECWAHKLQIMSGWELTDIAIGGTGFIRNHPDVPDAGWNVARRTDFTQYDIVTVAYGVNDWKYNTQLGTFNDDIENPTTIYAGVRATLEAIIASNPYCKIFVISPVNCSVGGNETTNWGIGYKFSNNTTLDGIYQMLKECCEYYGVELIDMTHSSIINRKNIKQLLLDDVHPTAEAHTVMAHEIGGRINWFYKK